jgi:hypothetical protein
MIETAQMSREQLLREYLRFHAVLRSRDVLRYPVRFYFPTPPDLFASHTADHFDREPNLYKEDVGTFLFTVNLLEDLSVGDPASADFFVLPLNAASHPCVPPALLDATLSRIRDLQTRFKKRLIVFSCSDFNHRPYSRSTPFERALFPDRHVRANAAAWIADDDLVMCFESTVDTYVRDLPLFPLVMTEITQPRDADRFLFGFVGEFSQPHWPEGFVRSPSRQPEWETLKRNPDAAILTPREASAQFERPFYDLPRMCTFTLCPRGIANWSFRLYEAILAGSIPVILSDYFVKPFGGRIPWDVFSVTVPEADLANVPRLLASISPTSVNAMKGHLREAQAHFTANGLADLLLRELSDRRAAAV